VLQSLKAAIKQVSGSSKHSIGVEQVRQRVTGSGSERKALVQKRVGKQ